MTEVVAIVSVGSLLLVLLTGIPVAFGLTGLSALLLTIFYGPKQLYMVVAAVINQLGVEVFLAIPMFVFMAVVLQFSGIASSIYQAMYQMMGGLRGGLAMSTVGATAIIAAMSGIGATGTVAMGLIALPEMLKRGYNRHLAIGCITAGGALGPIIPPSTLMIIVGGYAQLSVGKLFMGGVVPGLIITLGYWIYIWLRCQFRIKDGPPLPSEEQVSFKEKILSLRHMFMPFALIFVVLGVIYAGVCTPTEAAGIGASGALIIALINGKLNWDSLKDSSQQSMKVSCMVMWLVIGGSCYSSLINVTGLGHLVTNLLSNMTIGAYGLLAIILLIVLIMGMFIDPVAISMICIPIFLPAIKAVGLDPLWVMLLFIFAVTIGYITPPFGLNLFYTKGIVPKDVSMMDIYKGVLPFVYVKIACLILFVLFPSVSLWLPSLIK